MIQSINQHNTQIYKQKYNTSISNNYSPSKIDIQKNNPISFKANMGDLFEKFSKSDPQKESGKILKGIKDKYVKLRDDVTGWAKKKKIKNIQERETAELNGFRKAQDLFVKQKEEEVDIMKAALKDLKEKNKVKEDEINLLDKEIEKRNRLIEIEKRRKQEHQNLDDIAGYTKEKFILREEFIREVDKEKLNLPCKIPNSILFFGPTGNGKTTFVNALAKDANMVPEQLDIKDKSKVLEKLDEITGRAHDRYKNDGKRTLIIIDESDAILNDDSPILAEMQDFMMNCAKDDYCTVLQTTNNPLRIAEPILRKDRTSIKIGLKPPNDYTAGVVLKHHLEKSLGTDKINLNYTKLGEEISRERPEGKYSNSQIKEIAEEITDKLDAHEINEKVILDHIEQEEKAENLFPAIPLEHMEQFNKAKKQLLGEDN